MAAKVKPREARTFLDSNILLYAEDAAYPDKQRKTVELVLEHRRRRTGVVSTQVLAEFFHAATRKLKLDPALARAQVEFHAGFELVEPNLSDTLGAIDLHRLYGYTYWDSLLLRCALVSGCRVFLSEDMQNGQVIDGLRIVNPFLR
jgi:predicted nucleic acid-binding protein